MAKTFTYSLSLADMDANGRPLNARCSECGAIKSRTDFFITYSPSNPTGISKMCKPCCYKVAIKNNDLDRNGLYELCKKLDKPYIDKLYGDAQANSSLKVQSRLAKYFTLLNQDAGGYKNLGFEEGQQVIDKDSTIGRNKIPPYDANEAMEIFGVGWKSEEYKMLWRKYNLLLQSYPLRTEMHKEALIKYVKYAIREEISVANGDEAASEKWGRLAANTAKDAKINPNQLSVADLSDGMTCFSQLAAAVEKAQDIIPMLPQFKEEPKDRVDYILWEYINYARHLEGKPLVAYSDIYSFLDRRYNELKKHYAFMKMDEKGDFDEHNIGDE